jgi:hypothetical protein
MEPNEVIGSVPDLKLEKWDSALKVNLTLIMLH